MEKEKLIEEKLIYLTRTEKEKIIEKEKLIYLTR